MIISQTPVRISFLGGGTDFPEHFSRFGGAVLSTTVDKYCYLTVSYLSDFFDYRIKVSYSKTELLHQVSEIEHPAVRACLEFMGITSHVEINYFSDLPARTGLGTSSSFVVGLLNALYAYRATRVSARRLAAEAVKIEREMIKESVGFQDQYAAACGGFNYIEFKGQDEVRVEPLICSPDALQELENNLMLFYTGIQRYSDTIQKRHVEAIGDNTAYLKTMSALAAQGRDLLGGGKEKLTEFAGLLGESWKIKKSLGTGVTSDEIDAMYEAARRAGAIGGKLLGAGGGGFLLLYVEPPAQDRVRRALSSLFEVDFSFENQGSQIVFYDPEKLPAPNRKRQE
ncbi:MAG: kinase [Candidatus Aureabacteria bacterium]|nr:kinase [Candidatus Auribacterota bacterium]